ncbi:hypothetical protein, partial [Nocardia abscessus]|uniref:hypothetical protein n=1 Tax=Nocardia abscessus TaxID=120957 RepID=UPI002453EA42
ILTSTNRLYRRLKLVNPTHPNPDSLSRPCRSARGHFFVSNDLADNHFELLLSAQLRCRM